MVFSQVGLGYGRKTVTIIVSCMVLAGLIFISGISLMACSDDDGGGGTPPEIRHPEDFIPQGTSGMTKHGVV